MRNVFFGTYTTIVLLIAFWLHDHPYVDLFSFNESICIKVDRLSRCLVFGMFVEIYLLHESPEESSSDITSGSSIILKFV